MDDEIAAWLRRQAEADIEAAATATDGPWQVDGTSIRGTAAPEAPRRENPGIVLDVPEGSGRKPDDFYGRVADAFSWLAARGQSPAKDLADANNVPVTTVHRWVKEARSRGLLPPAIGRGAQGWSHSGNRSGEILVVKRARAREVRHIIRHDPLTETARAESVLAVLDLYGRQAVKAGESALQEDRAWTLEPVIALLAYGYRHREGWKETWKP